MQCLHQRIGRDEDSLGPLRFAGGRPALTSRSWTKRCCLIVARKHNLLCRLSLCRLSASTYVHKASEAEETKPEKTAAAIEATKGKHQETQQTFQVIAPVGTGHT